MVIVLIGYVIDVNLRRKIYKNLLCLLDEKLEVYTYIDKVSQEYTVSKKALYKDFYANNLSVAYFEINEFEKYLSDVFLSPSALSNVYFVAEPMPIIAPMANVIANIGNTRFNPVIPFAPSAIDIKTVSANT